MPLRWCFLPRWLLAPYTPERDTLVLHIKDILPLAAAVCPIFPLPSGTLGDPLEIITRFLIIGIYDRARQQERRTCLPPIQTLILCTAIWWQRYCVLKPFFVVRGGLQKALTERFNDGEKDRWRQGEEQVGRDKGGQTVGEGKLLVFVTQGKTNSCSVLVSLSLFPSTDLFNTCTFSPSRACSLSLSFPRHLVAVSIHV